MNTMVRTAAVFLMTALTASTLTAQSAANYSASRSTGITYTSIMSGGTEISSWRGSGSDDNRSNLISIGFDFWYMGTRYTQFNVTTNGIIDFNTSATDNGSGGAYDGDNEKFLAQSLTLAPLYDNLSVASLSNIKYQVSGTFPSRVLTVEWSGADVSGNTTPDLNFQIKLYEGTGVVEFVYGTMTAGSATYSYTVGIRNNSANNPPNATQALMQQTANTATFSSTTQISLSTVPESNSSISLTPPVATTPTGLNFTLVKWNRVTLNWTDNASNELAYAIYRSSDGGTTFSFVDSVDAGVVTFTNYSLTFNTSYQWRVCAVTEGGLGFSVAGTQGTNAGLLTGTVTVGPTGTYSTLTAAIAAIRTDGVIGNVVFELQSTYTSSGETFPINLSDSTWSSASKTITIRPASGATALSISSSNATGTLRFNKANYFIVDGRPGGTGSSQELTIENTSTTGYAVEFINMAGNNILRYCSIKGVNTNTSEAVIMFTASSTDDDGVSNSRGNFNNTVTNNNIGSGATTPYFAIIGGGLSGKSDSNTTISNNNIFNFFAEASTARGISYAGFTENLNITGNSFYQTASRTATGTSTTHVIHISGSGVTNVSVKDNFIGGSSASAGGSAWTVGPITQSSAFIGIVIQTSSIVCSLQNNTIRNISITTSNSSLTETLTGIYIVSVDTAYILSNTIGSSTGTGSISMTSEPSVRNSFRGIYSISGSNTISNNVVGSIAVTNSTTSKGTAIYGIVVTTTTELATISGNTIGSTDTPGSISQNNAISSSVFLPIVGISHGPNGFHSITNNTVANLKNNSTASFQNDQVMGIQITSSAIYGTVSGNTIRSLTTANSSTNAHGLASVIGINHEGSADGVLISNNTIDSIRNTHASAAVHAVGIYYSGSTSGANIIERNKITNILLSTSHTSATIKGIVNGNGNGTFKNNMVSLGEGLTTEYGITGIMDTAATSTVSTKYYYNTVRIGGTGVGTGVSNTFAFRRVASNSSANDTVMNNIFINARSNSSTGGKHYGYSILATSVLISNYNNIYVSGTGGVFGASAGTDRTTLALWRTNTSKDANSVNTSVTFVSNTDLHVSGGSIGDVNLKGTPITWVTNDYDNHTRPTSDPYMGADENTGTPLPVEIVSFSAVQQGNAVELRWATATETDNFGFSVERSNIADGTNLPAWKEIGFVEGNGTSNRPHDYQYSDPVSEPGKYLYRLKQIDHDGSFSYSPSVEMNIARSATTFALAQNFPNPFNPSTTFSFTLQRSGFVSLMIYDVIGRVVATVVQDHLEAGITHRRNFDARRLAGGVYFAALMSEGKTVVRRISLIK